MDKSDPTTMYLAVGGLAGFVVLVLVIALLVRSWAKKRVKAWLDTAAANGLSGGGTWPLMTMSGSLDGISVGISHEREVTYRRDYDADSKNDKRVKSWCEAYARIPGGADDLQIAEEGVFAKLAKLVGAADIQTGDAKFDKRFTVKSSSPERAKTRLQPAARAALLELEDSLRGEITVQQGRVQWKGGSVTHDRALEIMRKLAATARSFQT